MKKGYSQMKRYSIIEVHDWVTYAYEHKLKTLPEMALEAADKHRKQEGLSSSLPLIVEFKQFKDEGTDTNCLTYVFEVGEEEDKE